MCVCSCQVVHVLCSGLSLKTEIMFRLLVNKSEFRLGNTKQRSPLSGFKTSTMTCVPIDNLYVWDTV